MAAFTFTYAMPGLYKAPAEVAGAICQQLSESEGGLTPETLLNASRDADAPLHNEFEWRDDIAAEKYRLMQARGIIQNLRIVIKEADGSDAKVRSFVVTSDRNGNYIPLQSALSNDAWKKNLLVQAKRDAEIFAAKYRRLEEVAGLMEAINDFLKSAS